MPNYAENMYNYLKERGYANKYEYKGVYCIKYRLADSIHR